MTIVMGLDQHRAQITADWVDTSTGEVSRARVAPADRAWQHRVPRASSDHADPRPAAARAGGGRCIRRVASDLGCPVQLMLPKQVLTGGNIQAHYDQRHG